MKSLFLTAFLLSAPQVRAEFTGRIPLSVEGQYFWQDPLDLRQEELGLSFSTQPLLVYDSGSTFSAKLEPFLRWDRSDENRTHWDVRESSITASLSWLEVSAGIKKVFWGVTEYINPVDVINQKDIVEDVLGKEKLGQPMVQVSLFTPVGKFELYGLYGFRQQVFPAAEGRPRTIPLIDSEQSQFIVDRDLHYAGRWSVQLGDFDLAASHFIGTSRDPVFTTGTLGSESVLVPIYDDIMQTGLEAQFVYESLILKFEGVQRLGTAEVNNDFLAISTGFEYQFSGCMWMDCQLRLFFEYLGNDQENTATGIYQRDVFSGIKIDWNNTAETRLKLGSVVDLEDAATLAAAEFETGLFWGFRVSVKGVTFFNVDQDVLLKPFRFDDYVGAELSYYFSF